MRLEGGEALMIKVMRDQKDETDVRPNDNDSGS